MSTHTTLITTEQLHSLYLSVQKPAIFDCQFDLTAVASGHSAYMDGHLPGAHYLHLDVDLSGSKTGRNGRHPLPEREVLAKRLRQFGLQKHQQVVLYDAQGGIFAARAWWLLRWLGHSAVAVLDGGIQAWQAAGRTLESHVPSSTAGDFQATGSLVEWVSRQDVLDDLKHGKWLIVDARSEDRFHGQNETLDALAGHIPGAVNRFYRSNLQENGLFKPAAILSAELNQLLQGRPATLSVQQCGSGVTACHNLLALEVVGLSGSLLYPGSWSEWSSYSDAPLAT
ncbi:sulfurtransferase [Pseudomonas ogarae]|uniref:sulfurtransferase n=1 Tax=Pseudomonas ogarae (strain DSM 112162 / CECT 30235 / F113) TaxID=1114970 RepID=UPI0009A2779D|nr:sulfurtransferase [Pseudomonas ogarae]OPG72160.1 sulfurtransferase [Pseudomonas ogarae]